MYKKSDAIERYDKIVLDNINNIDNIIADGSYYKDPDQIFEEKIYINSKFIIGNGEHITIRLASDGLCGIKKIRDYSMNKKADYECIRKGMFECLIWPAYATSINQGRGFKSTFDDRLDLMLKDLEKFYDIICNGTNLSISLINKINDEHKGCKLAKTYLNIMTFAWLCSFKDFNDFIVRRNLQAFVKKDINGNYYAKRWTNDDENSFNQSYFNELIKRIQKYRESMKIDFSVK